VKPILIAYLITLTISQPGFAQAKTMKSSHPVAYKLTAPVRLAWKPIKKMSDVTRFTKLVVLTDDCLKVTSKRLEPYSGLTSVGASAYGMGVNSAAVLIKH